MKPRIIGRYRDENGIHKSIMWKAANSDLGYYFYSQITAIKIFNEYAKNAK